MNSHPTVFATLFKLYWWLALVPAVWIPVVVLYGGPVMHTATMLYWSVLGLAFFLARAKPQWERILVSSHLGMALLTAIYCLVSAPGEVVQGLSSGEWRLGVVAFLTIGMYVFASFTGVVGLLVGLGIVFLAPWPSWESRLLLAAGSFLAAVAGVSVHKLLYRLEALQQLIQREAITDALTGLANRRALERDFSRYQALANREGLGLAISLWDLDNLKTINDRQGHKAGDAHLAQFAQVLREEAREGDMVYRVGGDEFVGLHIGLRDGASLEDRVKTRFPQVTVGFTQASTVELGQALELADTAMYAKKKAHTHPAEETRLNGPAQG